LLRLEGAILGHKMGFKGKDFWAKASEWIGVGSGIGVGAGLMQAHHERVQHQLIVDNTNLQHQVDELKDDQSFVRAIMQEKLEKSTETPVRSQ
jgi:hypothetical protein